MDSSPARRGTSDRKWPALLERTLLGRAHSERTARGSAGESIRAPPLVTSSTLDGTNSFLGSQRRFARTLAISRTRNRGAATKWPRLVRRPDARIRPPVIRPERSSGPDRAGVDHQPCHRGHAHGAPGRADGGTRPELGEGGGRDARDPARTPRRPALVAMGTADEGDRDRRARFPRDGVGAGQGGGRAPSDHRGRCAAGVGYTSLSTGRSRTSTDSITSRWRCGTGKSWSAAGTRTCRCGVSIRTGPARRPMCSGPLERGSSSHTPPRVPAWRMRSSPRPTR